MKDYAVEIGLLVAHFKYLGLLALSMTRGAAGSSVPRTSASMRIPESSAGFRKKTARLTAEKCEVYHVCDIVIARGASMAESPIHRTTLGT